MSRIVAPLVARHHFRSLGQKIGDLALPLVSPHRADDDHRGHNASPLLCSRIHARPSRAIPRRFSRIRGPRHRG
ncbi:MAG: hypothetical protein HSCHL_2496 [Hydrogenibacillus schlegelii]|uniref:Uncharacterized protein n=1 Tax=Hydrogenibacillus schlegelii TaxID=1484 RepID=A0A2T5G3S4_HYDSH|nr:MAG: hypothetical protein HSCHL_2496 [Hydrogenibacillus schlegelii]